ncbi:tail fiber protein [Aquimarina aquimarini]|uniref:tail fiber protein n=1 Tax=Aquimarina aquimarini TaxID=1191734 RepID=UPI001F18E786|nr:tail fiber protein [Aquimarina aquimarini]
MKNTLLSLGLISFVLFTNAQENKIDSTGNVGIGTTNPTAKLEIKGSGDGTEILKLSTERPWVFKQEGTGPSSSLVLQELSGNKYFKIKSYDNNDVYWIQSSSGDGYFKGKLGIGTTNPSAKLEIKGSGDGTEILKLSTERPWVFKQEGTGPASSLVLQELSGNKYFKIKSYDNNDVYWIQSSSGDGYFKGKLGIGTTSPDMKLTVNGNIHAEEVKIDLNIPAPDYVFKEDYNLRSIEEVATFIKENSHLPEIPSAKEFEQNGVMQAEMDMSLLKKIEELTLYTIQQEKKIQKLERENEELKSLSDRLTEIEKLLESKK